MRFLAPPFLFSVACATFNSLMRFNGQNGQARGKSNSLSILFMRFQESLYAAVMRELDAFNSLYEILRFGHAVVRAYIPPFNSLYEIRGRRTQQAQHSRASLSILFMRFSSISPSATWSW